VLYFDSSCCVWAFTSICCEHTQVREVSPLRSFSDLHLETGLALPTLFKLALHLQRWGHMRVVTPISEDALFCVHPDTDVSPDGPTAAAYAAAFGARPALSYVAALHLFSTPRPFGALLKSQRVPARRLVQATVFLWQKRAIQQLCVTLLCAGEPPPPPPLASAAEQARWRLLRQLRPMLFGEHSVEELVWHEGVSRRAIDELVRAYPSHLLTVVMPAMGEE